MPFLFMSSAKVRLFRGKLSKTRFKDALVEKLDTLLWKWKAIPHDLDIFNMSYSGDYNMFGNFPVS